MIFSIFGTQSGKQGGDAPSSELSFERRDASAPFTTPALVELNYKRELSDFEAHITRGEHRSALAQLDRLTPSTAGEVLKRYNLGRSEFSDLLLRGAPLEKYQEVAVQRLVATGSATLIAQTIEALPIGSERRINLSATLFDATGLMRTEDEKRTLMRSLPTYVGGATDGVLERDFGDHRMGAAVFEAQKQKIFEGPGGVETLVGYLKSFGCTRPLVAASSDLNQTELQSLMGRLSVEAPEVASLLSRTVVMPRTSREVQVTPISELVSKPWLDRSDAKMIINRSSGLVADTRKAAFLALMKHRIYIGDVRNGVAFAEEYNRLNNAGEGVKAGVITMMRQSKDLHEGSMPHEAGQVGRLSPMLFQAARMENQDRFVNGVLTILLGIKAPHIEDMLQQVIENLEPQFVTKEIQAIAKTQRESEPTELQRLVAYLEKLDEKGITSPGHIVTNAILIFNSNMIVPGDNGRRNRIYSDPLEPLNDFATAKKRIW